jgi:hypothetical protein
MPPVGSERAISRAKDFQDLCATKEAQAMAPRADRTRNVPSRRYTPAITGAVFSSTSTPAAVFETGMW